MAYLNPLKFSLFVLLELCFSMRLELLFAVRCAVPFFSTGNLLSDYRIVHLLDGTFCHLLERDLFPLNVSATHTFNFPLTLEQEPL